MSSNKTVILEEQFDETYEPSPAEIKDYADFLGMDIEKEKHLFWIARESLKAPLPLDWKPCQSDDGNIYYFNFKTGQSIWDHPCDEFYKKLYQKAKVMSPGDLEVLKKERQKEYAIQVQIAKQAKKQPAANNKKLAPIGSAPTGPGKLEPLANSLGAKSSLPAQESDLEEIEIIEDISRNATQKGKPSTSGSQFAPITKKVSDLDIETELSSDSSEPAPKNVKSTQPSAAGTTTAEVKKELFDSDSNFDSDISEILPMESNNRVTTQVLKPSVTTASPAKSKSALNKSNEKLNDVTQHKKTPSNSSLSKAQNALVRTPSKLKNSTKTFSSDSGSSDFDSVKSKPVKTKSKSLEVLSPKSRTQPPVLGPSPSKTALMEKTKSKSKDLSKESDFDSVSSHNGKNRTLPSVLSPSTSKNMGKSLESLNVKPREAPAVSVVSPTKSKQSLHTKSASNLKPDAAKSVQNISPAQKADLDSSDFDSVSSQKALSKDQSKSNAASSNAVATSSQSKQSVQEKKATVKPEPKNSTQNLKNGKDAESSDFDSASSKQLLGKETAKQATTGLGLEMTPKEHDRPKVNPTAIELERKMEKEQAELMTKYSKDLLSFQENQEAQYKVKIDNLEQQLLSKLANYEQEIDNVMLDEISAVKTKLTVDVKDGVLSIKYPKQKSNYPSIDTILETFRLKFDTRLTGWFSNLVNEYKNRETSAKSEIEGRYEKELTALKEEWAKEGDLRIKRESEALVRSYEERLEKLRKNKHQDFEKREQDLFGTLQSVQAKGDQRINELQERYESLEIEMQQKYISQQRLWDEKFKQLEKKHFEYEIQSKELKAKHEMLDHERKSLDDIAFAELKLVQREKALAEKESALSRRENEIEDLKKMIKEREDDLEKSKIKSKEYMDSLKEALDREMLQFQRMQHEAQLSKAIVQQTIVSAQPAAAQEKSTIKEEKDENSQAGSSAGVTRKTKKNIAERVEEDEDYLESIKSRSAKLKSKKKVIDYSDDDDENQPSIKSKLLHHSNISDTDSEISSSNDESSTQEILKKRIRKEERALEKAKARLLKQKLQIRSSGSDSEEDVIIQKKAVVPARNKNTMATTQDAELEKLESEFDALLNSIKRPAAQPQQQLQHSSPPIQVSFKSAPREYGLKEIEKKRLSIWASNQKRSEALLHEHQAWLNNFTLKQKELS